MALASTLVIWGDAHDPPLSEFALPVTAVNESSHVFGGVAEQSPTRSPKSVHDMDGCHRYQRARCAVWRSAFLTGTSGHGGFDSERSSGQLASAYAASDIVGLDKYPHAIFARGARSVSFPPNLIINPTTFIMRARVVGSCEPRTDE